MGAGSARIQGSPHHVYFHSRHHAGVLGLCNRRSEGAMEQGKLQQRHVAKAGFSDGRTTARDVVEQSTRGCRILLLKLAAAGHEDGI
jgi:hypothetical protein